MHAIKPIRNEADYDLALQEIDRCLDAEDGTPERDRLEVLSILVDDYEARHHAIDAPDPIAAIEFVLEQRGLTRKDLEDVIGSSGRISEVMNRQRPLTLNMIRRLMAKFELPADLLVGSTHASTMGSSRPTRVPSRRRSFVLRRSKRLQERMAT